MMEHERLAVPDTANHPPETTTLRWSNFLTLRVVPSQRLVVTSTSYVQPEFRNPGGRTRAGEPAPRVFDHGRGVADGGVRPAVRFGSPDGITRLDTTLRTGVTYTY
jgi:hypothetical protein